jgi:hypothetical protein
MRSDAGPALWSAPTLPLAALLPRIPQGKDARFWIIKFMIIADSATHAQGNTRDGVTVDIPGHVMAESGVTEVAVTVVPDIPR